MGNLIDDDENYRVISDNLTKLIEEITIAKECMEHAISLNDWKEVGAISMDLVEMEVEKSIYEQSIDYYSKRFPTVGKDIKKNDGRIGMRLL